MMFRPLAFDFPEDNTAKQAEDQLFLGNELMIAPIYKQNAQGRYVYLPEEMMMISMKAIPLGAAADNTSQIDMSALRLLGYDGSTYELYSDNGYSPEPEDSLKITTL